MTENINKLAEQMPFFDDDLEEWSERLATAIKARSRDVGSIVSRSIRGALDEDLFFLHLEKCGGTSLHEAIRRGYRTLNPGSFNRVFHMDAGAAYQAAQKMNVPTWEYRRRLLAYALQSDDYDYVAGHFQIDRDILESFSDEIPFLALFRHPVERWLSHYFFNRYKEDDHGRIEMEIEEYLETPRAQKMGSDYVQVLTGTRDEPASVARDDKLMSEAKSALDEFELVGLLEKQQLLLERFEDTFGSSLQMYRRNRRPMGAPDEDRAVSDRIRQKIRQICEPNLKLYEHIDAQTEAPYCV